MTETKFAKLLHIKIEKGEAGLFYATSPDLRGLLVAKPTQEELEADIPRAITELYALSGLSVVVSRLEYSDDAMQSWVAFPADVARRALDSAIRN